MNDSTTFKTDDIDLAAYLDACGHIPTAGRFDGEPLTGFTFMRSDRLLRHIEQFVTGEAVVSAKALLAARRRLFRSIRAMGGGHGN